MTAEVVRRRTVLGTAAAATLAPAGLLAGCAMGWDDGKPKEEGQANAKNPLGVKEDAPLEVVIFNGGFGEEYAKAHEAMYTENVPEGGDQALGHPGDQQDAAAAVRRRQPAGRGQQLRRQPDRLQRPGLPGRARRPRRAARRAEPGRPGQDGRGHAAARRRRGRHRTTASSSSLNYAYTAYGIWYSQQALHRPGLAVPEDLGRA